MIITRQDVMKLYESMKRNDKSELIEAMGYNSSTAFKSYYNNPNLLQEEIGSFNEKRIVEHLGGKEKAAKAFKKVGANIEQTLEEKLNEIISIASSTDNVEELKKIGLACETIVSIAKTKIQLISKK